MFGRKQFYIHFTLPKAWLGKFRFPKFGIQVPLFEFMSCFKIRAKTLQISLGHTFHPIEVKLGVLPILVLQNQINIYIYI
jgi:hypothetical protein